MSYIGNTPAENYASFLTETFSVSATANYTLSHAVTNENEIRLVINGVVQQPGSGKAYTASGTTLTLTSATVSGDVMYAVYLGRALQTVNPPNASVGTSQLASSLDLSSKTITLASNMKNTPAFLAQSAADQTVSNNTDTKVTLGTEVFDTDNAFASSRFTVPSGKGGKYFFYGQIRINVASDGNLDVAYIYFAKNGTVIQQGRTDFGGNNIKSFTPTAQIVLALNAGDYIELFGAVAAGDTRTFQEGSVLDTYMGGYKIIE